MQKNSLATFADLFGQSPALTQVIRAAKAIASTDVTVLLMGASGTGKELLAQAMHQASHRCRGPFHAINCAALPETLAEAELFGHAKGAFTGADTSRPGWIRASDGGTLLLDEIGDMPLPMQAKLLRFLESGELQILGQQSLCRVNVRIMAATHVNLAAMVQEKKFRQDLFFRLNIVPLELPTLHDRLGDLELLLDHLTNQQATKHHRPPPHFSPAVFDSLHRYAWPGNVRELKNFCERMVLLHGGETIQPDHLPPEMRSLQADKIPWPMRDMRHLEQFVLPNNGLSLVDLERHLIEQALHRSQGNRTHAARLLGLSRDTLLYRLKKYSTA
ncbi:MAG: sigma 54-interacting transcriptional regulator [Magnetococcus sp. DMHC-1]|nr:sigma 54-interacting transcriptional regulator [Magnetococcales bacterium]